MSAPPPSTHPSNRPERDAAKPLQPQQQQEVVALAEHQTKQDGKAGGRRGVARGADGQGTTMNAWALIRAGLGLGILDCVSGAAGVDTNGINGLTPYNIQYPRAQKARPDEEEEDDEDDDEEQGQGDEVRANCGRGGLLLFGGRPACLPTHTPTYHHLWVLAAGAGGGAAGHRRRAGTYENHVCVCGLTSLPHAHAIMLSLPLGGVSSQLHFLVCT